MQCHACNGDVHEKQQQCRSCTQQRFGSRGTGDGLWTIAVQTADCRQCVRPRQQFMQASIALCTALKSSLVKEVYQSSTVCRATSLMACGQERHYNALVCFVLPKLDIAVVQVHCSVQYALLIISGGLYPIGRCARLFTIQALTKTMSLEE